MKPAAAQQHASGEAPAPAFAAATRVLTYATLLRHIVSFQAGLPFLLVESDREDQALGPNGGPPISSDGLGNFSPSSQRIADVLLAMRHQPHHALFERMAKLGTFHLGQPSVGFHGIGFGQLSLDQLRWFHVRGLTKACATDTRLKTIASFATTDDWASGLPVIEWLTAHAPDACVDVGAPPAELYEPHNFEHFKRLVDLGAIHVDRESIRGAVMPSSNSRTKSLRFYLPLVIYLCTEFPDALSTLVADACASAGDLAAVQYLHERYLNLWTPTAMDGAARNGHLDVVRFLHKHRTEGCTSDAMHHSAINGHLDVVEFLHAHRREGCTRDTLPIATEHGHVAVVRFLARHRPGHDVSAAILAAVKHRQTEIMHFLVEECFAAQRSGRNEACARALQEAAHLGDLATCCYLHDNLHPVCCPLLGETENYGTLRVAALGGHLDIIRYLLRNCENARNVHHVTVGCISRWPGALDVIQLALDSADAAKCVKSVSWPVDAAASGDLGIVQFVLDCGAPCAARMLAAAAKSGNLDVVEYLMEHYPAHMSSDMLTDAVRHNKLQVLQMLHLSKHALCPPRLINSALEGYADWDLLMYLHENCAAQIVSEGTTGLLSRLRPMRSPDQQKRLRTITFLLLMRPDSCVGVLLERLGRVYRRQLFLAVDERFPEVLVPFGGKPWCCQLRALRARVERGEALVAGPTTTTYVLRCAGKLPRILNFVSR